MTRSPGIKHTLVGGERSLTTIYHRFTWATRAVVVRLYVCSLLSEKDDFVMLFCRYSSNNLSKKKEEKSPLSSVIGNISFLFLTRNLKLGYNLSVGT